MKGYSTKYALTQGIQIVEVEDPKPGEVYCHCKPAPNYLPVQLIIGKTFFETVEAAEANAMEQAEKKIDSLKKALTKVRQLAKKPKWGRPT